MDRVIKPSNPVLFERLFAEIQDGLASNIGWLNHIFGKAERLVKEINGRKYYTPNIYIDGNDYELIAPDSRLLGNYSFFVLEEPQDVDYYRGEPNNITAPFSLIVWFDIRTINDDRNIEQAKQDLLRALNGGIYVTSGRYRITRIYERAENIFKDYTLDEIDNQYLMHPFCGFRFYGEVEVDDDCY